MHTIVPFDARRPKTRLDDFLDPDERVEFSRAMLRDVLDVIVDAGGEPEVLSTSPLDCPHEVTVDERPLTGAVNGILETRSDPIAIVMADLALLTPAAYDRLTAPATDIVIAPGLGGGTNGLVVRHPEFRVDYHGISVQDHRERARECGATLTTVDSFHFAVDVDCPDDLVEVLIHSDGRAAGWLRNTGVTLETDGNRPTVTRSR